MESAGRPEDRYGWAPAAGMRTIESLLTHIALSPSLHEDMHRVKRITTLQGYDFGGSMARMSAEAAKPRSKADLIALLKREGERFAKELTAVDMRLFDLNAPPSVACTGERLSDLAGRCTGALAGLAPLLQHALRIASGVVSE